MTACVKLLVVASFLWMSSGCKVPSPAIGFSNERYFGVWYEVGKYETPDWSFFYKHCACTTTEIRSIHGYSSGEATALHSCRLGFARGKSISKTGVLRREGPPGQWREYFEPFTPSISYTVVYMDDNFALEFDSENCMVGDNYCVHVLSRKRTIDDQHLELLKKVVDELGLNRQGILYRPTNQKGCPL